MTALTLSSDIPNNINTLERLICWAGLALRRVNPVASVLETPGAYAEPVAQTVLLKADDNTIRLVVRVSVPIDPAYAESTLKFWMHAQELSNTVLPAAFKTAS